MLECNWEALAFYCVVGEALYLGAIGIILILKSIQLSDRRKNKN